MCLDELVICYYEQLTFNAPLPSMEEGHGRAEANTVFYFVALYVLKRVECRRVCFHWYFILICRRHRVILP